LVVLWSRTRGKSMKIITPHLGYVLSEVSCQNNMGHCKVSDMRAQGNRCWNTMYVIELSEPQRRTTWGYTCSYLFISIQSNLEVIFRDSLEMLQFLYYKFTLAEKTFKKTLHFLDDLAVSKLGYNLICNSC